MSVNKSRYYRVVLETVVKANNKQDAVNLVKKNKYRSANGAQALTVNVDAVRVSAEEARSEKEAQVENTRVKLFGA
jgi:hypothetical protein